MVALILVVIIYVVTLSESTTIERKCGEIQTYNVSNRTSTIYIPSFACDKESYLKFFSIDLNSDNESQQLLPIPIIVSLHGFGNNIYDYLTTFTKSNMYAEQYGFIVIAPIGLFHSWNGIYCCGEGVAQNINDLQFIKNMIASSITDISILFKDIMIINSNNVEIFITGMSNGGFMTDEIAWAYALGELEEFIPITAFAPYLGYIYDVNDIKSQMSVTDEYLHKSIPILFQHGDKDRFVRLSGCCHKQVCAGGLKIDSFKENCTSLYEEYKKWLNWNHCHDDITFESIAQISQRKFDKNRQLKCATATPKEHGCDEITKMCVYMGNNHDAHIGKNIDEFQTNGLLFFYQVLCLKYNGIWDIQTNFSAPCICYNQKRSLFCMEELNTLSPIEMNKMETTQDVKNEKPHIELNTVSPTQHPSVSPIDVMTVSELLGAMSTMEATVNSKKAHIEFEKINSNFQQKIENEEENNIDLMFMFWITVGCVGGIIVKQCLTAIHKQCKKQEYESFGPDETLWLK